MFYVISQYWLWEVLALALGAVIGWLTFTGEPGGWLRGWFKWALVAFAIGLLIALVHLIPGRPGHYLETALLLFACYIIGGHLGAWLRQTFGASSQAATPGASASATASAFKPAVAGASSASAPVSAAPVLDAASAARGDGAVAASAAGSPSAVAARPSPAGSGAPATAQTAVAARKPDVLDGAANGRADPLARIRSITQADEARLNKAGVFHFDQIAAWDGAEAKWAGAQLGAPGRVEGENWVGQARGFAEAAGKSKVATATSTAQGATAAAGSHVAAAAPAHPGTRPAAMVASGPSDNLKLIKGIGPRNEAVLKELGIHRFGQIAGWDDANATWVGHHMAFPGRVGREHWVDQARLLSQGIQTDHALAVAAGKITPTDAALEDAAVAELQAGLRPAASAVAAPAHAGAKPAALAAAEDGKGDNLKLIKGIGPRNEAVLHGLGVWHFRQIAGWDAANQTWVGHHMAFPGRVEREHWVDQAKLLAAGVETEHARAVRTGALVIDDRADEPMDAAKIAEMQAAMPKVAAAVEGEDKHGGQRPLGLAAARGGKADDLKRIRGIGPQNEQRLQKLGIWHFDQIAAWTREQVKWVGSYLAFPGRIDREDWIAQAKLLAQGHDTAFSKRVDAGGVPSSKS